MIPENDYGCLSHLTGTGRKIFLPSGLQGAEEIFGSVAHITGLSLSFYNVPEIFPKGISTSLGFHRMIHEDPAFLLVPASVKLGRSFTEEASGRVPGIGSVSTGTDHADLNALQEAGIRYIHAPGANAGSVAEYVTVSIGLFYNYSEINRIKAGIIGFGRVGQKLAHALKTMGIRYQWYDPFVSPAEHAEETGSLKEVLDSDIITFHVNLTKTGPHPTYQMADDDYINQFRKGALVINTSRGSVFSERSFRRICSEFRTVIDVFPEEPPSQEILQLPDYVTPHTAGYSYNARAGGTLATARSFLKLLGVEDPGLRYEVPEYDHYITSLFPEESLALKSGRIDFLQRRSHYPPRGSVSDSAGKLNNPSEWILNLQKLFKDHEL